MFSHGVVSTKVGGECDAFSRHGGCKAPGAFEHAYVHALVGLSAYGVGVYEECLRCDGDACNGACDKVVSRVGVCSVFDGEYECVVCNAGHEWVLDTLVVSFWSESPPFVSVL